MREEPRAGTQRQDGKGENSCEKAFHDCVLQSYQF
jgi:hypothetical protein